MDLGSSCHGRDGRSFFRSRAKAVLDFETNGSSAKESHPERATAGIGGVYSSESAMRHDKETEHTSYTMQ
jgi:hypothetical protein